MIGGISGVANGVVSTEILVVLLAIISRETPEIPLAVGDTGRAKHPRLPGIVCDATNASRQTKRLLCKGASARRCYLRAR